MNLDESLENKIALITIKIRTIDKEFPIEIKNDETIKALKEKIETVRKYNLLIKYYLFIINIDLSNTSG